MLQRDYIQRLIREFMAALERMLEKKEVEVRREKIKELYNQYVGPYAFYSIATIEDGDEGDGRNRGRGEATLQDGHACRTLLSRGRYGGTARKRRTPEQGVHALRLCGNPRRYLLHRTPQQNGTNQTEDWRCTQIKSASSLYF